MKCLISHFLKRRGYLKGSSSECFVPFPFCLVFFWPLESQFPKKKQVNFGSRKRQYLMNRPHNIYMNPPRKLIFRTWKWGALFTREIGKKHHFCRFYVQFRGTHRYHRYPIPFIDWSNKPRWWNHWLTPLHGGLESFWNPFFLYFQSWNPPQHQHFGTSKVTQIFNGKSSKPTPPWLWGSSSSFCFEVVLNSFVLVAGNKKQRLNPGLNQMNHFRHMGILSLSKNIWHWSTNV